MHCGEDLQQPWGGTDMAGTLNLGSATQHPWDLGDLLSHLYLNDHIPKNGRKVAQRVWAGVAWTAVG